MKSLLVTLPLAAATVVTTARAEFYRPSVVGDTTVLGAVAGALVGGHNGDRWAEGAVIGAAAGAILGTAIDNSRPVAYSQPEIVPVTVVPNAPVAYAPVVATAPQQVVYVTAPAPAPRVVYVNPCPAPVVVARPVVYLSAGWGYGYGYGRGHWDRHSHGHYRGHGRW